jgi:hypothetical protein
VLIVCAFLVLSGSQAGRRVGIARRDRLYQRHLVEGYDPIGSLTWVATDTLRDLRARRLRS